MSPEFMEKVPGDQQIWIWVHWSSRSFIKDFPIHLLVRLAKVIFADEGNKECFFYLLGWDNAWSSIGNSSTWSAHCAVTSIRLIEHSAPTTRFLGIFHPFFGGMLWLFGLGYNVWRKILSDWFLRLSIPKISYRPWFPFLDYFLASIDSNE